jgi:hypothetical protein
VDARSGNVAIIGRTMKTLIIFVDIVFTALFAVPFLFLAWWSVQNWKRMHDKNVEDWSEREGLCIVRKEARLISPWMLYPPAQRVYRVTLQHGDGRESLAWLKSGGAVVGPRNRTVQILWTETEESGPGSRL